MKILEARDGYIKFEADAEVSLASFIQIDGMSKNYIAQVVRIKRSGISHIAYAKILFIYDGSLKDYDKTLPGIDSKIKHFTFNILTNAIDINQPVIAGKTIGENININIDASAFDKNMFICSDNKSALNMIINNMTKQFNNLKNQVLVIDMQGIIDSDKYIAGSDFKLPLDTSSLAFIYNECLTEATEESKATVIDIFKELSEYSKTVQFLPFEALKQIIDDMVDKSHIFKLLVVKNKLAKFKKDGCFALNEKEVTRIDSILEKSRSVIDLSKLDPFFQNKYIEYLYRKLLNRNNTQVFFVISNSLSKKSLKIVFDSSTKTAFAGSARYKYLNNLKSMLNNFIITPSFWSANVFKEFDVYLKSIPQSSYLIFGSATKEIPLVSNVEEIFETIPVNNFIQEKDDVEEIQNVITEDIADNLVSEEEPEALIEEDINISTGKDISTEEKSEEVYSVEKPEIVQEPTDEVEVQESVNIDETEFSDKEQSVNTSLSNEEVYSTIDQKSADAIDIIQDDINNPSGNLFDVDNSEEENSIESVENVNDNPEDFSENTEMEVVQVDEELSEYDFNDSFETTVHEVIDITEDDLTEKNNNSDNLEIDETSDDLEIIDDVISEESFNVSDFSEEIDDAPQLIESEELLSDEQTEVVNAELSYKGDDLSEESLSEKDNDNTDEKVSFKEVLEDYNISESVPSDIENYTADNLEQKEEVNDFIELDPNDAVGDDIIIVDMDENVIPEEINNQIVQDVDKVFTTRKGDELSDSDLDLIDEMNSEDGILGVPDENIVQEELLPIEDSDLIEEVSEDGGIIKDYVPAQEQETPQQDILETKSSTTPMVPVYDADIPQEDMVASDPIQQGDSVTNVKYGNGIVEKMIKYGNKNLYSINFENVGRRLVDPTLTEIKKA